jgi:hypothetical protein
VHDEPERVDVALCRHLRARELLGRHVSGSALADPLGVIHGARGGNAEVHQLRMTILVQHDVGGLQVAMQDAEGANGGEPRANLTRQLDTLLFGEWSPPPQRCREILPFDVLHREKQMTVDVADVVHAAHVRVRDLPGEADLVVELREPPRIARQRGRQELQRDLLAETEIVGLIDDTHAAAPERSNDAVAIGEQRAGRERGVI